MHNKNIIVAVTGASGVVYARRLLQIVAGNGIHIHLVVSNAATDVIEYELGVKLDVDDLDIGRFLGAAVSGVTLHHPDAMNTPIISGGFKTAGMVIIPCSMNTLCSVSSGLASNVICRAAGVTLKEGRRLVLVPRETPFSAIHLESMLKLSQAGACILPATPGFYHRPQTIDDLVDFVIAKALDYLHIEHEIGIAYI